MKAKYIVRVDFLDHVSTTGGVTEPIPCTAYGLLIAEDKNAYYISSWISDNKVDDNTDSHTILKSAVKKLTKIKKEKI